MKQTPEELQARVETLEGKVEFHHARRLEVYTALVMVIAELNLHPARAMRLLDALDPTGTLRAKAAEKMAARKSTT